MRFNNGLFCHSITCSCLTYGVLFKYLLSLSLLLKKNEGEKGSKFVGINNKTATEKHEYKKLSHSKQTSMQTVYSRTVILRQIKVIIVSLHS